MGSDGKGPDGLRSRRSPPSRWQRFPGPDLPPMPPGTRPQQLPGAGGGALRWVFVRGSADWLTEEEASQARSRSVLPSRSGGTEWGQRRAPWTFVCLQMVGDRRRGARGTRPCRIVAMVPPEGRSHSWSRTSSTNSLGPMFRATKWTERRPGDGEGASVEGST